MNATSDPASPAVIIRALAGWALKYVACSALTILLPICLGALVFVLIVLMQPGGPLQFLHGARPDVLAQADRTTLHAQDLSRYIGRGFLLASLALTLLSWLWRVVRRRRGGTAKAGAASQSDGQRVRLHLGRSLLIGFGVVTVIHAGAFACVPFARMAAHASPAGLFGVFLALYVFALVFTTIYVVSSRVADRVLDG